MAEHHPGKTTVFGALNELNEMKESMYRSSFVFTQQGYVSHATDVLMFKD